MPTQPSACQTPRSMARQSGRPCLRRQGRTALAHPDEPVLPLHLQRAYYLSATPCKHNHTFMGSGLCLRRKSNHGCAQCNQAYRHGARAARHSPPQAGRLPRPELPGHLRESCFLSPIVCEIASHRWRNALGWTLRFLDTEGCVQCATQPLAGDEPPGWSRPFPVRRPRRGRRGSQSATVGRRGMISGHQKPELA